MKAIKSQSVIMFIKHRHRQLIFAILLAVLWWSPWLNMPQVEDHIVKSFNWQWREKYYDDGCGTNCKGCGVISSEKIPFGLLVTIEYGCGLLPEDSPQYHRRVQAYISPWASTLELSNPGSVQMGVP